MIAGLIAGGANLAMQAYSAKSAQEGQAAANRAQMEFNANEALKQRDWEESMYRHRYQYTRQDLEAAGYNPLLALGGTPPVASGAAAHAEPKSETSEASQILANSGKQSVETMLSAAMTDKILAEGQTAKATARLAQQEADIGTSDWGKKLAAFRYFMDKSGVGRGLQNVLGIFGAKGVIKALQGNGNIKDNVRKLAEERRLANIRLRGRRS